MTRIGSPPLYKTAADMRVHILSQLLCTGSAGFLGHRFRVRAGTDEPYSLSLMPNGGDFRRIGHRYLTGVNPEFKAALPASPAQRGVHLLGGCCDVHPRTSTKCTTTCAAYKTQIQSQMEWDNGHDPTTAETKRDNGPFLAKYSTRNLP